MARSNLFSQTPFTDSADRGMEDRVAVKVRVARAGQTEFVRKDTGLMIEKAAFFEDVLSRCLSLALGR